MSRTARVLVTFFVTFLVAGGCSTHVGCGCAIHSSSVVEDGSISTGSGSNTTSPAAHPKESMVAIAAGTYVASDPVFAPDADGRCSSETRAKVEIFAKKAPWPDRPQAVDAFTIDRAVTTCSDYRACVASGSCSPVDTSGKCKIYPAIRVTIDQAIAYCKWRGAQLPTLLQWQAAVRGPTGKSFGKCDDEASKICTNTSESGVSAILGTFAEFTRSRACWPSHDGSSTASLQTVLVSSFSRELTGFATRALDLHDDPQEGAFRCVRDELVTGNSTKDH